MPDTAGAAAQRAVALVWIQSFLRSTSFVPLDQNNPFVLSYLRKTTGKGDSLLVVLNMTGERRTLRLELAPQGITQKTSRPLLTAPEISDESLLIDNLTLAPFGVYIGAVD